MNSLTRKTALILTLLATAGTPMAKTNIAGYDYIKSSGGIDEFLLKKNGLKVLLMEDHSAPVVTFMVTYHVGSRNEAVGHTGSTHLLEHLMFKGSRKFNKENGKPIWTVLQNVGAQINATTWLDRTNYFELLPSEHLERAVQIEADRMRNAFLRDEDRQPEMTVVRNEFERGENDPWDVLDKNIWATAYQAHPYHHSTIGWKTDIENVSTDRLKEFYNTYYWPNNATVTIIGDFKKKDALNMVKRHFGKHKSSSHEIPVMYTEEPEQQGPRRLILKRSGQTGIVGIAHKSPQGIHEDTYSLQIISKVLGDGKSSRLYRKIVDKGLATGLFMWDFPFKDNGLFITYVFMTPGADHAEVEKIILDEYASLQSDGITADELNRAKAQIKSEMAFSRDGSYSIASALNEAIATGDWTFYTTYADNINSVKRSDVKAAAQKYFHEDQSTTGYFIPNSGADGDSDPGASGVHQPLHWRPESKNIPGMNRVSGSATGGAAKSSSISSQVSTSSPLKGITLYTMPTTVEDVVTIRGSILGGDEFSPDSNPMIADLTAAMLDEGTKSHNKLEISEMLESVGASVGFSSGMYRVNFSAKCLKKDIQMVLNLLAEQLKEPAFNENDLTNVRRRYTANLKRAKENTRRQAMGQFRRTLYPKGHPNYSLDIDAQIQFVENITSSDLSVFHKNNYGLGTMIVSAVGDLDSKKMTAGIRKAFKGWKISSLKQNPSGLTAKPKNGSTEFVMIEDKTSADMVVGIPIGIDRNHPDYYPLMLGNYILGGNFSARLMQTVRDKEGLTYGIGSRVSGVNTGNDGFWYVSGTFAPDLLNKGRQSALKQIKMWVNKGVTAEELENKKTTLTGSYKVGLATTSGLAGQILANAERGRELSFLDEYPGIINGLLLKDVNDAIKTYININNLVTVGAGTVDKDGNPLSD